MRDVTDEIEDQSQIEDLKNQAEQQKDDEAKPPDAQDDEKQPIEMDDDFDAPLEDFNLDDQGSFGQDY